VTKITQLVTQCRRLSKERIVSQSCFSRSQLYRWLKGEQLERKQRARKVLPEQTVENAACVIGMFPHFSGRKGQDYLLYHELGLIGEKAYEGIKRSVRQLFLEEVGRRELFGEKAFYEHIRPQAVGEIWAEDFTELVVEGATFRVALLQDVFDQYYLGRAVAQRATASLVGRPVDQALVAEGGRVPKRFLLSDNGSQYISEQHGELLTSQQIVQRRIPACVPQYNGWIECGMRQFKSVFYNVWERRKREAADEEKSLLERVEAAVAETTDLLNDAIPRPCLGGVTPADVHFGRQEAEQARVQQYQEAEKARCDVAPWQRSYREILKSGLGLLKMTSGELLTKLAFFGRKPLRRIAQRNRESVG
jgi:transposase InsO family protein